MRDRRNDRTLGWRMHPIWRGIGFLFLILVPIIAYFLTGMVLDYIASQPSTELAEMLQSVNPQNLLYLQIVITVLLSVLLYLILTVFGSLVYNLMGGRENEELVSRIGSQRKRY